MLAFAGKALYNREAMGIRLMLGGLAMIAGKAASLALQYTFPGVPFDVSIGLTCLSSE